MIEFWKSIDTDLADLVENGSVKLPTIKGADWLPQFHKKCIDQMGNKTYGENIPANLDFLDTFGINKILKPKLIELADNFFGLQVDSTDVYSVCRLVRAGTLSEGYRGHFDSHLFTLVTPINIPNFGEVKNGGQLNYFPKSRAFPKTELSNIAKKISFKRFNSEAGFNKLSQKSKLIVDDFSDYRPLLFVGNTTFHGNAPVDGGANENRMTILTHFFDPSPKHGVGALMRRLRNR